MFSNAMAGPSSQWRHAPQSQFTFAYNPYLLAPAPAMYGPPHAYAWGQPWGHFLAQPSWSLPPPPPQNQSQRQLSPLYLTGVVPTLPQFGLPPSPTDTCSSGSSQMTTPVSSYAHMDATAPVIGVCAVPLLAPRPLPYHSPRFLQFDDLPDISDDLSQSPCRVQRKRKRVAEDEDGQDSPTPAKRSARPRPPVRPLSSACRLRNGGSGSMAAYRY